MNTRSSSSGSSPNSCYKTRNEPESHFIEHSNVGTWYLSLAISLFLVLIGLYIHWSVVLLGLLLPFIPMVSFLVMRRAARKRDQQAGNGAP
jgi:hypothetical protein